MASVILVVDDEEGLRRLAEEALSEAGYDVVLAEDGLAALEILHSGTRVDLLLTDVVMPRMGGVALAHQAERLRPALPIIFMSGYVLDLADLATVHATLLPKPWRPRQLIAAIETRL